MSHFSRDGFSIHYETHGSGPPVVLLHGICVSFAGNFGAYGWIERLCGQGLRVIGMDFRGHGQSDKPHDSSAYGTTHLADDVIALLDHLGLDRVSLMGYSLGSVVALHLLHTHPDRFTRGVLIATGDGLTGPFAVLAGRGCAQAGARIGPARLPGRFAQACGDLLELRHQGRVGIALLQQRRPAPTIRPARRPRPAHVAARSWSSAATRTRYWEPVPGSPRHCPTGAIWKFRSADHFNLTLNEQAQKAVATFLCEGEDHGAIARS